jgi:serine/threonine protein kinase
VGKGRYEGPGKRSLGLRKLLRRFLDVCTAIEYAHSRGVLHRDIKPGNVIAGRHGETLVVDWGLTKARGRADAESVDERPLVPSSCSGKSTTLPGAALGTPASMSLEQARGDLDRLGPKSDVHSLGANLYCLLTGRPPFQNDDVGEVVRAVQRGEFPSPSRESAAAHPIGPRSGRPFAPHILCIRTACGSAAKRVAVRGAFTRIGANVKLLRDNRLPERV